MVLSHAADTHLGFQSFAGARNNTRKYDFYRVFGDWVQETIKRGCGSAVIAGDLFDSPDPDNETLNFVIEKLYRLADNSVSVILVSGNHDTPKSKRTHIYQVLDQIHDKIHAIYDEVKTLDQGGCRVVAVPWFSDPLEWGELPGGDILVVHSAYSEQPGAEYADRVFDPSEGHQNRYSYVALGDWHKRMIADGVNCGVAHYPGSLEHTSFGEQDNVCGANFVDIEEYTFDYWDSPAREMLTYQYNLDGLDDPTGEINELLEKHDKACVRLRLSGSPSLLDVRSVEWHPLLQLEFTGKATASMEDALAPFSFIDSWEEYSSRFGLKERTYRYGRRYLG